MKAGWSPQRSIAIDQLTAATIKKGRSFDRVAFIVSIRKLILRRSFLRRPSCFGRRTDFGFGRGTHLEFLLGRLRNGLAGFWCSFGLRGSHFGPTQFSGGRDAGTASAGEDYDICIVGAGAAG